ncbi:MAG: hypothetical protein A2W23_00155 [Planctomycetes bacterium RBG_16_43_13]|nr:MAG: hypothetical protein A2W23_00155 [Planctomycetes bacterium RBG_16_43_13]
MQKDEASKIVLKLAALFPNTDVKKETIATWIEYLLPLRADIIRQAVHEYALSPGKKFFPTPGEVLDIYDKIYQEVIAKRIASHQEDERQVTKLLFCKPLNQFADDYIRKSVELIRDVCARNVTYRSGDWNKRFSEIYGNERMI